MSHRYCFLNCDVRSLLLYQKHSLSALMKIQCEPMHKHPWTQVSCQMVVPLFFSVVQSSFYVCRCTRHGLCNQELRKSLSIIPQLMSFCIQNGPRSTWVSSSIATYLGVRSDSVPFKFWWTSSHRQDFPPSPGPPWRPNASFKWPCHPQRDPPTSMFARSSPDTDSRVFQVPPPTLGGSIPM